MIVFSPAPGIVASRLPASDPALGPAVVLAHLKAHPPELGRNPVGATALVARWALDPAQRFEGLMQPLALGLRAPPH